MNISLVVVIILTASDAVCGGQSGLVPALAGISHVAIQFPTYEKIKYYLAEQGSCSLGFVIHEHFDIQK